MMQEVRRSRRSLLALLALGAPLGLLAACGKKGAITPPEGEEAAYKRNVYPDPASVVPGGRTGPAPPAPRIEETEFGRERTTTTVIQSE
jgi:hypothetical protein